jgi:hypothetical protein
MATLHLTLRKKWFDMIASGEKLEEYREIKTYWINRLLCDFSWDINQHPIKLNEHKNVLNKGSFRVKEFDSVTFRNGYGKNAPTMIVEFKGIEIGKARPEWSDNWQGEVFIIKLGNLIKTP